MSRPRWGGAGRPRSARSLAWLVVLAGLVACQPLYVPLVPTAPDVELPATLADDGTLSLAAGRPRLQVSLASLPAGQAAGGWLAVQWFGPAGAQAASDARWVDEDSVGAVLTFDLPADIAVTPGEWRAIVSLEGMLLRQFRVDVTADPER